jgi:glycosyltransferase involved in cell wall biosynthesis
MALSIVVPTRDRPELLDGCLRSLRPGLRDGDELIVVDSASTDPNVAHTARANGALVIRCDRPGVGVARNAGWRAATNDAVVFVDDDVRVAPEWADAWRAVISEHPDAAFFTGRIGIPPEQRGVDRPVAVKDEEEPAVLDASTTGSLGHSANLAVHRWALDTIGGFDEQMGAGGRFRSSPEYDLFDRLFAAGWTGRYEPAPQAWHEQWRTRAELVRLDYSYGTGTGARLAKLVRTNRPRSRAVAREHVWENGLRRLRHDFHNRYKTGLLLTSSRLSGTLAGFARAIIVPVRGGHFAPPRRPR